MVKKRSSQLVRLELLKTDVGIEDKPQEEAEPLHLPERVFTVGKLFDDARVAGLTCKIELPHDGATGVLPVVDEGEVLRESRAIGVTQAHSPLGMSCLKPCRRPTGPPSCSLQARTMQGSFPKYLPVCLPSSVRALII